MTDSRRIDSWKEIATYLGRDVRTVRRWESRGLPVHRIPNGLKGRVFAYEHELQEWLANGARVSDSRSGEERHPARSRSMLVGLAISVVLIGVSSFAIGRSMTRTGGAVQRLAAGGREIVALDAANRTVWTYELSSGLLRQPLGQWTRAIDLDDDGREEIFAAVNVEHPSSTQFGGTLIRFSPDGVAQWAASVDDTLQFRAGEYAAPWPVSDLALYRVGNEHRIAWSVHHFTWWPSMMVAFNARGERVGSFVNAGWIRSVVQSPDGRYLLATGVTNSQQAYFIAALDAENPTGRSPEPPGSMTECVRCPQGDPKRYFVLPRTDISLEQDYPAEGPTVEVGNGVMHVHVRESGGPDPAVTVYTLSSDLTIAHASFSDSLWTWHRRLEREGRLRHSVDACPDRQRREARVWTRESGWQNVAVTVR